MKSTSKQNRKSFLISLISKVVYGQINSINYYFSFGMLALFVDQPVTNSYGFTGNGPWNHFPSQPNNKIYTWINNSAINKTSLTFRQGFITYDDVWDVRHLYFLK
jgi:hypothetical protein